MRHTLKFGFNVCFSTNNILKHLSLYFKIANCDFKLQDNKYNEN